MNVVLTPYDCDPSHGKGRCDPQHFGAPPPFEYAVAARARRLGGSAIMLAGCWDMLPAVNAGLYADDQGQTLRCYGHATAKRMGLFQYGQTGNPIRMSADWAYKLDLSEIRRIELGGAPTYEELLANPFTDTGSEPSAGYAAARRFSFATEAGWNTPQGVFSPKELDLAGLTEGESWKALAADFASLTTTPGPALTQAALVALSKTASGKRGTTIGLSLATANAGFDNADGSQVLTTANFNGPNYDHAPFVLGAAHVSLVKGYSVSADESPSGFLFLGGNSWGPTWSTNCMVPELDPVTGMPTGNMVPAAGLWWMGEKSFWQAADLSTIQEMPS